MGLSNDLISQFVKATKDTAKTNTGVTVYGTIVTYNDKNYVRIDGSDLLTPISTTTDTKDGERVTVSIKDHTATVTGNISSPAARTDDVKEVGNKVTEIGILVSDKASIGDLDAEKARIDVLIADNVTIKKQLVAVEADIETLEADNVTINEKLTANEADIESLRTTKLDVTIANAKYATIEDLDATNATIHNLEVTYGQFEVTVTNKLEANTASIEKLQTAVFDAETGNIKFANIDFSNIGKAAIESFYAKSGLIKDVVVGDGTITGELVGVTIKGDLIEGNTVKADKLVVKGTDGLYYKLNIEAGVTSSEQVTEDDLQNGLSGEVIIAKTITAEKINVHDLVAFDATIGGFNITDDAIYSGVKESADNNTRGIYMDNSGQFVVGDTNNYFKYYRDEEGNYRLDISAASIHFGSSGKNIEDAVDDAVSGITVGSRNLIRNSKNLIFDNYQFVYYANSAILGSGVLGQMVLQAKED